MDFLLSNRSCYRQGSERSHEAAGNYLDMRLGDYGQAVTSIEMTAYVRGGDRSYLSGYFDDFYTKDLPSLPKVKFLRKKRRIEIRYETRVFDANYWETYPAETAAVFNDVLKEVAEQLYLMDGRLKKADGFDLVKFHADVAALVGEAPQTDADVQEMAVKARANWLAKYHAKSPLEQMGFDKEDFHPKGVELLRDEFFWLEGDDDSPHGNDAGSDFFRAFKKWNKRNPETPTHVLAFKMLEIEGADLRDYDQVDETGVKAMLEKDGWDVGRRDDLLIAAAFAEVKLRGCCNRVTKDLAFRALARQTLGVMQSFRTGEPSEGGGESFELMRETLMKVPERAKG